ncbi:MAG: DUF3127 domain-containing protein [Prevotella sp.]|nr:DUF3127 domain-containing protein [Prevotella sp.]
MEQTGKIIYVGLVTSGKSQRTGNTWHSQDAVLEVQGKYPRRIAFTVFGEDRIRQFGLCVGMECVVQFDIDASEYNGRWYNKITAYNVKNLGLFSGQQAPTSPVAPTTQPSYPPMANQPSSDDLPF